MLQKRDIILEVSVTTEQQAELLFDWVFNQKPDDARPGVLKAIHYDKALVYKEDLEAYERIKSHHLSLFEVTPAKEVIINVTV
ncbi:MAG: hypothetical protein IBX57_00445 [Gammaproteobacteria bacterium]|nr:hypothetical protein [Gammaproteobacteria bacterium]